MSSFHRLLIPAAAMLLLAACGKSEAPATAPAAEAPVASSPTALQADMFIAKYNDDYRKMYPDVVAAQWVQSNFITDDTQLLASRANERQLSFNAEVSQAAKPFYALKDLKPETARGLTLIRVGSAAPGDAKEREEVAKIGSKMEANYGTGKWCKKSAAGNEECLTLQAIEKIVDNTELKNTPAEIAEAWAGWHATAKPIRKDYVRFIELQNNAAGASGYQDMGEMWRAGYDMPPADFAAETERLWSQVKPLYDALHCAVRTKLNGKYGDAVVPKNGLIPAHLLGNMWAQQWSNLYPLMEPYQGVSNLDVTAVLKSHRDAEYQALVTAFKGKPSAKDLAELERKADAAAAVKMTQVAEEFYTSLGFPSLPKSFYEKSLLSQPRDRDVVCHASAWDLNLAGDVRIKQCIEPNEEQLSTIHHELGHIYYFLMYNHLAPIFQNGAHDGFHEAIGDTVALSLTPAHLEKIGLVKGVKTDEKSTINSQMKLALDKITFLPWGKLVDQWRWK
ncbi:MAG: M2 family metallopeptidase, partial [Pseudomonadota bacterium]